MIIDIGRNPKNLEKQLLHALYPVNEGGSHKEQLRAMYFDLLDNGEWLINEDESGAQLFLHGILVRDKNGEPIEKSWDDFSALYNSKKAAAEREAIAQRSWGLWASGTQGGNW